MSTTPINFSGDISHNYEEYLGAFLFEPYAINLAKRLDFTGIQQILEIGCGTGRLTRHIADAIPPIVDFTATDINGDMIAVAKAKVPSERITWKTADMLALPFEDASFDLVVCQFGIMLVPDQWKAVAEIFRVLRPGGKVLFSTWTDRPANRVWAIGGEVLDAYLGESRISRNPGPYALDNADEVTGKMRSIGFSGVKATTVECVGEIESAKKAAFGFVYGLPVVTFIQGKAPELMPKILETIEERYRRELGEYPLRTPQKALIFEGSK